MSEKEQTVAILKKAKLLLTEKGFTKGWFAKDADGHDIADISPYAVCFCSYGAINRAACDLGLRDSYAGDIATSALEKVVPTGVPEWNDASDRTLEEVLAAFDAAITIVDGEG